MSKGFSAVFGAAVLICAAISSASAAETKGVVATHNTSHRVTVAERVKHQAVKATAKPDAGPADAAHQNQIIVSVGPQAMAVQRIRDIAMAPTG